MDKEKEIQYLAELLMLSLTVDNLEQGQRVADFLIDAGYRKADEVRKETANAIIKMFRICQSNEDFINKISILFGVEVDE